MPLGVSGPPGAAIDRDGEKCYRALPRNYSTPRSFRRWWKHLLPLCAQTESEVKTVVEQWDADLANAEPSR